MGSEPRGCARTLLYMAAIGFGAMAAPVILSVVMAPFLPERPEPDATTITQSRSPTPPESHTVARGDTLSSIAAEYGKTVDYLARRNNLDSADAIFVGQRLHLEGTAPLRPRRANPVSSAPASEPTAEPEPGTASQAAQVFMDCIRRNGASEDTCQEERETWSKLTLEEDDARDRTRQEEERRRNEQAKRLSPSSVRPRSGVPIETHDAVLIDSSLNSRQIQALAELVKAYGYRCDSITTARRGFFTTKSIWVLRCNGARYEYRIEDRGGTMVVTVE